MLSPNRVDHIALSKYAISSQSHVPTNLEKLVENPYFAVTAKKTFQGSILGLNVPKFRAHNLDENKKTSINS